MASSTQREFLLVLVDEDNKNFNIVGPMTDDTGWINRILELQNTGRAVKCFTAGFLIPSEIADSYARQTGYTFTSKLITDSSKW